VKALVRCLLAAGRTGEAVRVARILLDDRLQHGSGATSAHRSIGRALRVAGHPARARQHLRQAHQPGSRYLPFSYTYQHTVLELTRCARDLGQPTEAVALLDRSAALDPWFASRVSPALAAEVRLCLAEALGDIDEPTAAQRTVEDAERIVREQLGIEHPLLLTCRRTRARLLIGEGRPDDAIRILLGVRSTEDAFLHPADIGCVTTRLALADASNAVGNHAVALAELAAVIALAGQGVDAWHPALLAARVATARGEARDGYRSDAMRTLQPVLDRRPVIDPSAGPDGSIGGWNLPALEEGHPLLVEVRRLERRLRDVPNETADTPEVPWWALEE
jgi:hypothetical protein